MHHRCKTIKDEGRALAVRQYCSTGSLTSRTPNVTCVIEVLKACAKVVEGLVSDTRVVVATMDVFRKHRAGRVRGVAKGAPSRGST